MPASELTTTQKNVASIDTLSAQDKIAFAQAEAAVRENLESYVAAGLALVAIRENKWYRSLGYSTFEAYVEDRYQISKRYANYIIQSASVVENLIEHTLTLEGNFGNNCSQNDGSAPSITLVLPANVATARVLAELPDEEQGPVWQGVVEQAKQDNVTVTAARAQQAVDTHQGKTKPQPSVHHPVPTVVTQPTGPQSTKPAAGTKQANPTTNSSTPSAPERPKLLWRHEAQILTENDKGEEITTRYTIRDLEDGSFQIWTGLSQIVNGKVVELGARQHDVKTSLSAALKAVTEDAQGLFSINPNARVVFPESVTDVKAGQRA